ncbi:MAG: NADPH:quinone reductase [Rhodospirillales bacterium CG15_BIG_FIL_POST_REV_8_21_14_020_66_15]|nr:MAG: NADPH:quinone reductase [Rhodospirillales bacterium CG15_BIG_FIL_POST_REV_8_21_14_020_66_15]
MSQKTIITCAVTGSAPTPEKTKATPVTPEQIAQSSLDAATAGAAVCHIHVRDPKTGKPSMEFEYYKEVTERIRDAGSNMIINLTTGPGARYMPSDDDPLVPAEGTEYVGPARRTEHVEILKPEICSLDVATMNFGERAFMNVPRHMRIMADRIKAAGVKPELEVFDTGHIELCKQLIKEGHIDEPPYFQLCLGISYGATATPEAMMHMRDRLPAGAPWSAFGISRQQFPMVAQAVLLGGNVRVGLEDNIYLGPGEMAPSNAALVERAATIIENLGSSVATPDEARAILGLGKH